MVKRYLIFIWITTQFLITNYAFSEVITHRVDLEGDGRKEIVTCEDKFGQNMEIVKGLVTVYTSDRRRLGSFSIPGRLYKMEFTSLNKDNFEQIIAWSRSSARYTTLAIYTLKNNKLIKIFKKGSAYGIVASFRANLPEIKVGIGQLNKEDPSSLKGFNYEIWVWNGKKFSKKKYSLHS